MSLGSIKLLLGISAAGLIAAGVALVITAALWPIAAADDAKVRVVELTPRLGDPLPLASFAPAWSRDLRRPLTDDATATAAADDGNVLPVRLVGTIFDPARPRGIFVTVLGQMELRGVGEKAGGAEILRIDERSATLSIAGKPVTLKVEKVEMSIPGGGPDPAQPPSAQLAR